MPDPREEAAEHSPDEHFVSLVTYLNHLVRQHGIKETPTLWRADREELDQLHRSDHIDGGES